MGIIGWLVIGGLAGWLASIILGRNHRQGCIMNIVVGIIGAFIGGFVWSFVTGDGFSAGFDVATLLIATLGAVILLGIVGAIQR
jgi:uncharacterized membrane protein YeaQ/YmgE (transglycosylase-associated protein family)